MKWTSEPQMMHSNYACICWMYKSCMCTHNLSCCVEGIDMRKVWCAFLGTWKGGNIDGKREVFKVCDASLR